MATRIPRNAVTFTIPYLPNVAVLGTNARRRTHWAVQRKAQKADFGTWWGYILHQLDGAAPPHFSEARVDVELVFKTARTRDIDNLMAACKPLFDALKQSGVIHADDSECLEPHITVSVDKARAPLTVVRVKGAS